MKGKAIIAQAERERIARTVRDNFAYLKRRGHILGVIPQGYMRVDGESSRTPKQHRWCDRSSRCTRQASTASRVLLTT